jgi:alkylation response protein AidB-like acyl-CoA dehydrogenase
VDFAYNDEQAALKDSVGRLVRTAYGFEQARVKAATVDGFSRQDWADFAELGWLMLPIPEEIGGLGWGPIEAAVVMEEFGRGLVSAPYVSAVIAARLLAAADQPTDHIAIIEGIAAGRTLVAVATEEAQSRFDPLNVRCQARHDAPGFTIDGSKVIVPDGASADMFIVSAEVEGKIALFLVAADANGASIRSYRAIDGRRVCDLELSAAPATLLTANAALLLPKVIDEAALMLSAEAIGCMSAALEMTAEYLKTREQFGRPLAKFQVLTHRVADMYVKLENARSMLLRGLAAMDMPAATRSAAVSATMITVIEASEFVCGQAIQLHGGIGMTDEFAVGHYYKRIRAIGRTYGDLDYHRRRHLELTQRRAA